MTPTTETPQAGESDRAPSPGRRDRLLRELSVAECWAHLEAHSLGRIAYEVDGGPTILPFNYLAHDGVIWLRTASYSQLALHLPGRRAAFAVDEADERSHTGWSVLVRGRAEHALGEHPVVPSGSPDPSPWPDGTRTMVFKLTPDEVSGRSLTRDQGARALFPPTPRPVT